MEGLLEEVRAELGSRFRTQTGKGVPGGARGGGAAWGGTASNRAGVQGLLRLFQAVPAGLFPCQHLCTCFTGSRKTEGERRPFWGKLPLGFFKGRGRVSYTIKCW